MYNFIICYFLKNGEQNKQIANTFNVSESTVCRIIKKFNSTRSTECSKKGGNRRSLLKDDHKVFIQSLIDFNCQITLKKISERVFEVFGIKASIQVIGNVLKEFNYSLKKISIVHERRNDERNLAVREK